VFGVETEQDATTVTVTAKFRDRVWAEAGAIAAPTMRIVAARANILREDRMKPLYPRRNYGR
jgi:hypothetical protein